MSHPFGGGDPQEREDLAGDELRAAAKGEARDGRSFVAGDHDLMAMVETVKRRRELGEVTRQPVRLALKGGEEDGGARFLENAHHLDRLRLDEGRQIRGARPLGEEEA